MLAARSPLVLALVAACLTVACQRTAPEPAPLTPTEDVTRFRPMTSPRTDVAVFVVPRTVPATGWASGPLLARAIEAFEPDLLVVDAPAEPLQAVRDGARPNPGAPPWSHAPEVLTTLLPLADRLELPLVGFSAWTDEVEEAQAAYERAEPHGPPHRAYLLARARAQARMLEAQASGDLDWAYDPEIDELASGQARWLAYYSEHRLGAAGVLRQLSRQAATLEDLLDEHRSERVAIVMSLEDRFYLATVLALRDDVELVPVAEFFR